ncbi:MAG: NUDIX hydrolase [Bacteroidota bacterium]
MKNYYGGYQQYYVALDCVIFGFNGESLEIILIKRNFEPGLGQWALPGGFLGQEESLEQGSQRVLQELTGLTKVFMEQFHTFSDPKRDPGARIISTGFYALIKIEEFDKKLVENHNAFWKQIDELPSLMFDHKNIIDKAVENLHARAKSQPVGFELLPEKFTLPQLQKLYEAIFQSSLDKRNFRKKIMSMGILEKLDEKDKLSSKRGAFLYKFNKSKYSKKLQQGFSFDI